MNTPTQLGGYGALLAVVFAAAFGVGAAVGSDRSASDVDPAPTQVGTGHEIQAGDSDGHA